MNKLTNDERKKLTIGLMVAAALAFVAFRYFQGDGVFSEAGDTYSTPLGAGSLGQILTSLLIGIGTVVATVGGDLLKRALGWQTGPGAELIDAGKAELLELLKRLAAERLEARDEEGYKLVYELHDHCLDCQAAKTDSPPVVAPKP